MASGMTERFDPRTLVLTVGTVLLCAAFVVIGNSPRSGRGVPAYTDEIALNAFGNEAFLEFLRGNEGRAVYIDSAVDLSPATQSQMDVLDECNGAYPDTPGKEELLDGFVFNRRIVLPVSENLTPDGGCVGGVTLEIRHPEAQADLSHGGTGIVMFRLKGAFRLSARQLAGPETNYVLEYIAPRTPSQSGTAPRG